MTLTPEEQALKAALLALPGHLTMDSPEVQDWLVRAANVLGKHQLDPNEHWVYDSASDMLVKGKKH